jgi:hypothetical protein
MSQTARRDPRSPPSTMSRLDVVGVGLMAAAVIWVYWSSRRTGAATAGAGVAALLAAGSIAFWAARLVCRHEPSGAPLAVVAFAAVLLLTGPGGIWTPEPLAGPCSYAAITGAFFAQATIAALMLASSRWPPALKGAAMTAAVVFASVPLVTKTWTAFIMLLVTLPAMALSHSGPQKARLAVAGCAGLFLAAVAGSLVLGSRYDFVDLGTKKANDASLADSYGGLSERRVALWSDAIDVMAENPGNGVGPGRFREVSPVVQTDRDEPWAHNDFLQLGAETGLVGFLLLVGIFLWGFARLSAVESPDTVVVLGAVALAVLGVHACVEYVLQFPAVVLGASALVGTAVGAGDPRRRPY